MKHAIILGSGMVGQVMARDLAGECRVTLVDACQEALADLPRAVKESAETRLVDCSDQEAVTALAEEADIVLGALPSHLGLKALECVVSTGTDYCDISFMAEDGRAHNDLAISAGAVAVIDCGVAPGMSNMIAGHAAATMERCDDIVIAVGGLPRDPEPPFFYKAGFSPGDVLQEYTRPARVVIDGETVTHKALSDPVAIEFSGMPALEAFTTDGLRSLADTLDVPQMIEQTIRYPGHRDLMQTMRDMGLFSPESIIVDGEPVIPLNVTSAVMFPLWTYQPGEEDLTVMRITATGVDGGEAVTRVWELTDFYDPKTRHTSMSRVTAIPCTIVARMILDGRFDPGVHVPETLGGMEGVLNEVLAAHQARGITYLTPEA